MNAIQVDTIEPDALFGETALIYDLKRNATIRASEPSQLWCLHRSTFQRVADTAAASERRR